jgi:hypothetical protein
MVAKVRAALTALDGKVGKVGRVRIGSVDMLSGAQQGTVIVHETAAHQGAAA